MSDDIVTRLRQELPCWCDAEPTRVEVRDMCWEASAEIERLREEMAHWKSMSRDLSEAFYKGLSTEHTQVDSLLFRYELLCNGLVVRGD